MRLLLDTHALVWWVGGPAAPRLSGPAAAAIQDARALEVSAITCVEVAWLAAHGRLRFDREPAIWLHQVLNRPRVELIPITPEIAVRAAELDWDHRDPADRLIVATALERRVALVTRDDEIRHFEEVETVW